mgnify:CR=1 FL=1
MLRTGWRLLSRGDIVGLLRRLGRRLGRWPDRPVPIDYCSWRTEHVDLTPAHRTAMASMLDTLSRIPSFTIIVSGALSSPTAPRIHEEIVPDVRLAYADEPVQESAASEPERWFIHLPAEAQLHEAALAHLAIYLAYRSELLMVYADNDHLDGEGRHVDPYFKPDWNPDLLLAQPYLGPLVAVRGDHLTQVLSKGFWTNPHDQLLRYTAGLRADQIGHIPRVLATVPRNSLPSADPKAVSGHLTRQGVHAEVSRVGRACRVHWPIPDPPPRVSILIPTRDQGRLLRRCLAGLFHRTSYPDVEVVIVDHESSQRLARREIEDARKRPDTIILDHEGPFNFASMMNRAAEVASGDVLCLLNNDTEVLHQDWLTEMVGHACRPEVGAVGALLLFGDGTVQHAGVHPGLDGLMGHGHKHSAGDGPGYFDRLRSAHDVAAVTGACLVTARAIWYQLGGLDEAGLAVAYNDVDFCLRARAAGLRVVLTPHARLRHHESVSRGFDDPARSARLDRELEVMRLRWGDFLMEDPAYNPNLSLDGHGFVPTLRPRIPRTPEPDGL